MNPSTASFRVSTAVTYENLDQTLVLNVTSDFATGEYITVTGLSFTNFTVVSSPDYLGLDIYNTAVSYAKDIKTIQVISDTGILSRFFSDSDLKQQG